jgi:hypothetical protein
VKAFEAAYGTKFPKATAKITDDTEELLAFYDYPCEHWVHLRTTNPIESTFATVRHRTKVTKGPGSKAAGLTMAFKLIRVLDILCRRDGVHKIIALSSMDARLVTPRCADRRYAAVPPAASLPCWLMSRFWFAMSGRWLPAPGRSNRRAGWV